MNGIVGALQSLLVIALRAVFGGVLALILSVLSITIAWATYIFIFPSAPSQMTLLTGFSVAAGIGAGLGSYLSWRRVDDVEGWPVVLATVSIIMLAAIGGGWGGYVYGANLEVECCAEPRVGPLTYTAAGAAVAGNGAALVGAQLRELWRRRRGAPDAGMR